MPSIDEAQSHVRFFPPHDPLRHAALALALGSGEDPSESAVVRFVADAARRGLGIEILAGSESGGCVSFSCLVVESPGRAALLLVPWSQIQQVDQSDVLQTIGVVVKQALARGNVLIQTLVPCPTAGLVAHLDKTGFRPLAQLIYLRRRIEIGAPEPGIDLEWIQYGPERESLFAQAMQASYQGSLDCPELSELRTMSEVLEGHRSTGDFDPKNWFVVCRQGDPVGILLLSALPATESVEVVYMGVAQHARGTGVSDALLGRAVNVARETSAKYLALAVDSRNAPARRFYQRWRFVELTRRDAWIATPSAT